ncbi:3-oxoacyl-[acyl-carrier-protein] synthase 2 [compost metagenome]
MTGHLLGAAGAIESIITILAVKNNIVPGTINVQNLDPLISQDLNIVIGKSISKKIKYGLNNTFGFGGHIATIIFKK